MPALPALSDQVPSAHGLQEDSGCWEVCTVAEGWWTCVADAQWTTSCYVCEFACQELTACTFGTSIWGLFWTSSKREVIMCTWQLTKASSTWCRVITLILCLHLVLIISPVSNLPCKFPFNAFRFRCVDIHYHSLMIRSKAWWWRSNWQSNCYSAGSHSWAIEMRCTMPLNSAEINKDNNSYPSDPTTTCLYKEKKTQNQSQSHLWCILLKCFYTKGFIVFSLLPCSIEHCIVKGLSFPFSAVVLEGSRSSLVRYFT